MGIQLAEANQRGLGQSRVGQVRLFDANLDGANALLLKIRPMFNYSTGGAVAEDNKAAAEGRIFQISRLNSIRDGLR